MTWCAGRSLSQQPDRAPITGTLKARLHPQRKNRTNSNPYIVTEEMEGQLVKLPKKHWVFGIGATWNGYEPPAGGVFLGYKIFDF